MAARPTTARGYTPSTISSELLLPARTALQKIKGRAKIYGLLILPHSFRHRDSMATLTPHLKLPLACKIGQQPIATFQINLLSIDWYLLNHNSMEDFFVVHEAKLSLIL